MVIVLKHFRRSTIMHETWLSGKIESVNGAMMKSLLEEESDLVVFMYREDNR